MRIRWLWLLPCFALAPACSCGDPEATNQASSGTASGGAGGAGGAGGVGAGFSTSTGGEACVDGEPCGDDGVCAGGACCEGVAACRDQCCGDAEEVCSFGACVTPGDDCIDAADCAPTEYCELTLGEEPQPPAPGCIGGVPIPTGKCLPLPPICATGQDPANDDCVAVCEAVPEPGFFEPELKYAWGGQTSSPFSTDVMMTPIVVQLDDDDCDGKVTERDIPEIVFSTFTGGAYGTNGVLRAISIIDGEVVEKWSVAGVLTPTKQLAGGNFDDLDGNEVVGCGQDGRVHAFAGVDGAALWSTAGTMTCLMPSIADLDGDGIVEVVVEGGILDGRNGNVLATFDPPLDSSFILADLDGDGVLDIVTGSRMYGLDGNVVVDTQMANTSQFYGTQDWKSPWPAVADFDGDGEPEVVVIDNMNHALSIWRYDPTEAEGFSIVRAPVDINGPLSPTLCPDGSWGSTRGGGPPTIADFNGDGVPDVGTAGGVGYAVFDGALLVDPTTSGPDTLMWIEQTVDCSSASTGSSVFDFDGDGRAEVVYSDQQRLRIYDGETGDVLWDTCNTNATLIENPVIADVDNDGIADIVVVSTAYGSGSASMQCDDGEALGQSGVRVFGDATGSWVRTRAVWNQHAYHVSNVNDDGTIPQDAARNWLVPGLNNFRQNKQPGYEFAAPDAIVTIARDCSASVFTLVVIVRNVGQAALPAGVPVAVLEGTPPSGTLLGLLETSRVLYPLETDVLTLELPNASQALTDGMATVYAVVDPDPPQRNWRECRTDNNTSALFVPGCGSVN